MFVTKIKSVLAVVVVGLALGCCANRASAAQETTGDQALDGLWEDIENKGGWLRFEGSTIKYHPDGKSGESTDWTCRYNLTRTPMTIDIFQKDGTAHGIFVVERGTLFIALARPGEQRPTSFQRDEATKLFVLKRAVNGDDEPNSQKDATKVKGTIHVHGILESVDARNGTITVKNLSGADASSYTALLAVAYGKRTVDGSSRKLVNVPVQTMQTAADGIIGTGVGFAKQKLKMEDLKAGQVVMLQLTADRTTGLAVTFVRVVSDGDGEAKKP